MESLKVYRSGWMLKQGGTWKSWTRRYFVLRGATLEYYKDEPEGIAPTMPTGSLQLTGSVVDVLELEDAISSKPSVKDKLAGHAKYNRSNSELCLKISVAGANKRAEYLLQPLSKDDASAWVEALQQSNLDTAEYEGGDGGGYGGGGGGDQIDSVPAVGGPAFSAAPVPSLQPTGGPPKMRTGRRGSVFVTDRVRKLVSKKKTRYQEDGFDLDLTYITEDMIAMGFPSEGAESVYRNPMNEVQRFLETKHKGRYRIYNLCAERVYPASKFKNRVAYFPFDDHHACPLQMVVAFCRDVEEWVSKDPRNMCCVHCKAGKGRTGLMCSAWLVHASGRYRTPVLPSARLALEFYGIARTANAKGVTIPSQIRYVHYYEQWMRGKTGTTDVMLHLRKVRMHTRPIKAGKMEKKLSKTGLVSGDTGSDEIPFTIRSDTDLGELEYSSKESIVQIQKADESGGSDEIAYIDYICDAGQYAGKGVPLSGDLLFNFARLEKTGKVTICYCTFNTAFVMNGKLRMEKAEIDKANKSNKNFSPDFALEFFFAERNSAAELAAAGGRFGPSASELSGMGCPKAPAASSGSPAFSNPAMGLPGVSENDEDASEFDLASSLTSMQAESLSGRNVLGPMQEEDEDELDSEDEDAIEEEEIRKATVQQSSKSHILQKMAKSHEMRACAADNPKSFVLWAVEEGLESDAPETIVGAWKVAHPAWGGSETEDEDEDADAGGLDDASDSVQTSAPREPVDATVERLGAPMTPAESRRRKAAGEAAEEAAKLAAADAVLAAAAAKAQQAHPASGRLGGAAAAAASGGNASPHQRAEEAMPDVRKQRATPPGRRPSSSGSVRRRATPKKSASMPAMPRARAPIPQSGGIGDLGGDMAKAMAARRRPPMAASTGGVGDMAAQAAAARKARAERAAAAEAAAAKSQEYCDACGLHTAVCACAPAPAAQAPVAPDQGGSRYAAAPLSFDSDSDSDGEVV